MTKSSRKRAQQRRQAENDELLRRLNTLYGDEHLERDVFGRRVALPSEIARQLQRVRRVYAP